MSGQRIVVAGATGRLGGLVVEALVKRGAKVVALVRKASSPDRVTHLRALGVELAPCELDSVSEVAKACAGAECVVSTLLGVRDVMVDAQTVLLEGAVKAGVPRFIPSDYALDFNQLNPGENRNLDWHREFQERLAKAPIAATTILCGAFMELLVGPAPLILFKAKRVLYWSTADQVLDFTAMNDVAQVTAAAAMDAGAPKVVRIVGEQITSRELAALVSEVTGEKFKLTWAGTLGTLGVMIKVMRAFMPAKNEPFPPWQGMQYTHNMFGGRGKLTPADNDRYPGMKWTSVRELLATR
jgi:nucleoside-diphosphate-sugar epimerase